MQQPLDGDRDTLGLRRLCLAGLLVWLLALVLLLRHDAQQNRHMVQQIAAADARATYEKDLAYRRWASAHGGVYTPVTPETPPNPYLSHLPERDLTTPSGRRLTLVNPAYMTRQVHEAARATYGAQGHITSLKPMRPENAPDAWEAEALRSFEAGAKFRAEITTLNGRRHLRYMAPMLVEASCLKCHASQGYRVGDIRGGISVSVPTAPYEAATRHHDRATVWGLLGIWLLGTFGLLAALRLLQQRVAAQRRADLALGESQHRYRTLFDQDAVGVAEVNLVTGEWVAANDRLRLILGGALPALATELIHPDALPAMQTERAALVAGLASGDRRELRCLLPDGSERWLDVTLVPLGQPGEPISSALVVVHDTTDSRAAQADLLATTTELDRFFDLSLDLLCVADTRGYLRRVSPQWERTFGYPAQDLLGQPFLDLVHPDDQAATVEALSVLAGGERVHDFINRYHCADGSYRWIEWRAAPSTDGLVYAVARDITDRHRVEEALREAEERYRTLFSEMIDAFAVHEIILDDAGQPVDYRFLAVNPAFERQTGLAAERVVGHTVREVMPGLEQHWIDGYGRVALTGQPWQTEQSAEALGKWFEVTAFRPREGHFACIFVDATERRHAEQALRESEALLRESQRVSHVGSYLLITDTGRWTSSEELDRIFGIGPDFDRSIDGWMQIVHPDDREEILRHLQDDVLGRLQPFDHEYRIVRHDDHQVRWVLGRGALALGERNQPVSMSGTIQDITARHEAEEAQRKLELQLAQAHRMEAIGRLAGGVAHDFNNVLAAIQGYAELIADDLPPEDPHVEDIGEILAAARRAGDLTRQLLTFSRRHAIATRPVDLRGLVADLERMVARLLGEHIRVDVRMEPDLGLVRGDPTQLEQVVLNLCVNARDAMPDGGTLTIEGANATLSDHDAPVHTGLKAGRYARLCVSDTGVGMSAEVLDRIFEPFFSTKDDSHGTGLGLATVFGIVKQHGGDIRAYSEPGRGATFRVYLPLADETTLDPAEEPAHSALPGEGEVVLVMEDDASVRGLVCRLLKRIGYEPMEARSAGECFELAASDQRIDLLLTDVVMPEYNGREVHQRVLELRPGLPALFMSGYAETVVAHHGVVEPGVNFISKPFTELELSRKLRAVLADEASWTEAP